MRIASFNVQNLRLRPGLPGPRLDGARDGDDPADLGPGAARFDRRDRRLTAEVLRDADADVVALQEVFDRASLDHFHDAILVPAGVAPYPWRVCLPGNDGRGLDLALMSRVPLRGVASHAALTPADLGLEPPVGLARDRPIFRRDCLVAEVGNLTLWVCHFKAPWPDPAASWPVRRLEALALRRLIERRGAGGLWLIAGDFNEPRDPGPAGRAIAPLLGDFTVDLLERLPAADRWTWADPTGRLHSRPDGLLASPSLAARWPGVRPRILREGMGRAAGPEAGPRLAGVGLHRPHASDHAALVVDFPGLGAQNPAQSA